MTLNRSESPTHTEPLALSGSASHRPWPDLGLSLLGGLAAESISVYSLYFERYVQHQPDHNQSISLKLAQTIDGMAGNGEAYLMIWSYWYDGNAIRAQLQRTPQGWRNELWDLEPGKPPLDDAPGRYLVIMHPDERDALALLEQHFEHHVILQALG